MFFGKIVGQIYTPFHLENRRLVAFVFLLGNWYVARFGANASPVGPLWSISLEEQFYLVWPTLAEREVLRVLKPGGRLIIIAEVYKGAAAFTSKAAERYSQKTGMALLSVEEHRELFTDAGYSDVQVITEPSKGWICCIGSKALVS